MPAERSWQIAAPQTLTFDGADDPAGAVEAVQVRIVNGTVNVVGSSDPGAGARVEISEVHGPPLTVRREGGTLVVAYDDLPWKGFLKWLDRKGWDRRAVVSVSVPAAVRLSVGVVGASAVVSGVAGRTDVRGVSGSTTLVGLTGSVRADTVSGSVETQGLRGTLGFSSVSGDLTVMDGGGSAVKADSVSGDMILDVGHDGRPGAGAPGAGPEDSSLTLNTVSGEVAIRLPETTSAKVEANTAGGPVSSAFESLRVDGQWGARSVRGTLGTGSARIRVNTVSGAIALLRRPALPYDDVDAPSPDPLRKDV